MLSSTLTRSQFNQACQAYIDKYHHAAAHSKHPTGWVWKRHSSLQEYGFMMRAVTIPFNSSRESEQDTEDFGPPVDEQDSDAAALSAPLGTVIVQQHVVFSPTFQVPTFYFTIHHKDGSPLPLTELLATPLFRKDALPEVGNDTGFALTDPTTAASLLSQGDHPILDTPSWYLHPCHTAEMVEEVMAETRRDDWTPGEALVRWLEVWFMVLGNIVDFRFESG